jgi:pyridoxal phosphate enzyme (YggS family)
VTDAARIAANLAAVRSRIDAAARAAGRDPAAVRLVAVTKKLGADAVRAAYAAGQRDFGENYVQEADAKIASLATGLPDVRWHLIGRLQSNKAGVAVRRFALLHAIDSMRTVAAVSRAAAREGREIPLLLQIRLDAHTGGDRAGIEAAAAEGFVGEAAKHPNVQLAGLMGVADPERPAGPQFASLRLLRERLAALGIASAPLAELSMGMTLDLEAAVREGATLVRIGTAIFGERPATAAP